MYHKYIKSKRWRNISALLRKNYNCKICHINIGLEVHHLNYERLGHEKLTDLVVLCKTHHLKADQKRHLQMEIRFKEKTHSKARETFTEKKYGYDYPNADYEFSVWLAKKNYGEFGDW